MSCKESKKYLDSLIERKDGDKKQDNKKILKHIKTCKKCSEEYLAILAMKKVFGEKESVKIPMNFNKGVWDKIGESSPSIIDRVLGGVLQPVNILKVGAVAAAVMLVVVIGKYDISEEPKMAMQTTIEKKIVKKTIEKKVIERKEVIKMDVQPMQVAENPVIREKMKKQNEAIQNKIIAQGVEIQHINDTKPQSAAGTNGAPATGKSVAAASKDDIVISERKVEVKDVAIKNNVINTLQREQVSIEYRVSESSDIRIWVFNKIGEPVRKLVMENKQPGSYELKWGGEDDYGNPVGAGIYILHVKTDLVNKKYKVAVVR